MAILTRYNTGIAAIIILSIALFIFYKPDYSSKIVKTIEVNSPKLEYSVLIASQHSDYKNAIVRGIVENLKRRPVYIKVIDVTELSAINEKDWDAILVIHTWEYWEPPPVVKTWFEQTRDLNRVLVLATSGNGQYKMKEINAITSASQLDNINSDLAEILRRLDLILSHNKTISNE